MRRRWRVAAFAAPLVAIAGLAGALTWFSRGWIRPPRVLFEPPAEPNCLPFTFSSLDGVELAGWLLPGEKDRPALILCHGYQRCMEETFWLGVRLREQGYTVMLFDFRGCGRSGGAYTTIGDFEVNDLLGALRWLRERVGPETPIGVHGISMGGSVALTATALSDEVAAVVADSAFAHLRGAVELRLSRLRFPSLQAHRATMPIAEWICGGRVARVRPVDLVARIAPRPVLLIHGTADRIVPYDHTDVLLAALGENATGWTVPGGSHAMARFEATDEYLERVTEFFRRTLTPEREAVAAG